MVLLNARWRHDGFNNGAMIVAEQDYLTSEVLKLQQNQYPLLYIDYLQKVLTEQHISLRRVTVKVNN